MRIALFSTCIVDGMYPRVARATVEILERLGHEVVYPPGQTCCSQMHVNSGYFDDAYPVVKNHVESFEAWDWDVAVAPSGSCVASLGHQQPMIARHQGDEDLAVRAEQIAARTFELSQLLIDVLGITNAAEQLGSYFPEHVTYHSSCHGMRLLHLGSRQSDLVRTVEGIKYTEIEVSTSAAASAEPSRSRTPMFPVRWLKIKQPTLRRPAHPYALAATAPA